MHRIEVIDVQHAPRRLHFLAWVRFNIICEAYRRVVRPPSKITAHAKKTARALGLDVFRGSSDRYEASRLSDIHARSLLRLSDASERS